MAFAHALVQFMLEKLDRIPVFLRIIEVKRACRPNLLILNNPEQPFRIGVVVEQARRPLRQKLPDCIHYCKVINWMLSPQRTRYHKHMGTMTVDALKEAIAELPDQDKVALACWLNVQTMDDWDREMQRDFSPGGRGHHLVERVQREIAEGGARPLEEGFAARRNQGK